MIGRNFQDYEVMGYEKLMNVVITCVGRYSLVIQGNPEEVHERTA